MLLNRAVSLFTLVIGFITRLRFNPNTSIKDLRVFSFVFEQEFLFISTVQLVTFLNVCILRKFLLQKKAFTTMETQGEKR